MSWSEPWPPGRCAWPTLLVLLAAAGLLATARGAPPAGRAAPPRYLYYVQGGTIARLALGSLRTETLLALTPEESSIGADSIRAAAGHIAWLSRGGAPGTLRTWDGQRRHTIALERMRSGSGGFEFREDSAGGPEYVPIMEDAFDQILISPDGRQVAWNVNLITAITAESSGTTHNRHLIVTADLDGANRRLALDERFLVRDAGADHEEHRRIVHWSTIDPDRVFYLRVLPGQLTTEFGGVFACDLKAKAARPFAPGVERALEISPDEAQVIDTPADQSCCGGMNYTDNVVTLHDVARGRRTVLLDEWKAFGNTPKEEDDTTGAPDGVDYGPVNAWFSPDGRRVAFTVAKWDSFADMTPGHIALVAETRTGRPVARIANRFVLGWQDDQRLLLGVPRTDPFSVMTLDSLFTHDLAGRRETRLALVGIRPIAVGP
jgi:hypothetical protein